jgi:hypothetical protein
MRRSGSARSLARSELGDVFESVAEDILVRLTQ